MRRPDRTQVIAHRGASGYRPQNTLAAYELAVEQRADMIEIDLHRSRDGAIVIRHDEELQSLGGRGDIVEMDLAEIETLDGGQGEKIPTLDEVLDQFGTEMPFNLELKCGERGAYPDLEADTLAAVERRGLLGSTLFSSFDDGVLARLRSQSERARLAVLVSARARERPLERAAAVGAEAVNPWLGLAEPDLVDAVHAEGLAVYVYTVNEVDDMQRMIARGVDGMFTNFPDRLRALL
ncbi:MAG: glycerophosphodiester phosphodiesterase family protein [Myxococcota bacterium]